MTRRATGRTMLSEQMTRKIAAEAGLDVRTVRRVLAGLPVRSHVTVDAVKRACEALGILVQWPATQ